jgi:protein gp37
MAEKTIIAWTEKTFNGLWGCTKVSPGCAHCYAETLSSRYGHDVWGPSKPRREFGEKHWKEPLRWNDEAKKRGERIRVFCGSMWDWREDHPQVEAVLPKIHDLWKKTPWLDWQMLTKRAERIAAGLPSDWGEGYANVWLGVSIENNDYVWRADHLRAIPATVRFISYEPALGPLDRLDLSGVDWLIYGGESGPKFRSEDKAWARDMERRCVQSGTAFFHKQSAAYRTETGIELDGRVVRQYPTPRIELALVSDHERGQDRGP